VCPVNRLALGVVYLGFGHHFDDNARNASILWGRFLCITPDKRSGTWGDLPR
jgi:hypothetical protein